LLAQGIDEALPSPSCLSTGFYLGLFFIGLALVLARVGQRR